MDKRELYEILDIEKPEEFDYYENLADLFEADDTIDKTLIEEFLTEINMETFAELLDSYFDEFLKMIPDSETDFYVTVDMIKRSLAGLISEHMASEDVSVLADAIFGFREWYVHRMLVFDLNTGDELSVRDAIFNIKGSGFTGEKCNYDFRSALDYDADVYEVKIKDIIGADTEGEE